MIRRPLKLVLGIFVGLLPATVKSDTIETPSDGGVWVLKLGKEIFVRSNFSTDRDVVIVLSKGTNGQIDFQRTGLVKADSPMTAADTGQFELIHGCQDDAAPWKLNGTFIGGNHGWHGIRDLTIPSHGLKTSDLGKPWSGEDGGRFYLLRVVDDNRIWMIPENDGDLENWKFQLASPGKYLTEENGPRTLKIEKEAKAQLVPACRITQQEFLLDGKTTLEKGKAARGEFLEIREAYDIINPAAILNAVKEKPGQLTDISDPAIEALLTNKISYKLQPWGACTIHHQSSVHRSFNLDYTGFVQTRLLARRNQDSLRYYIPGTLPFQSGTTQYDFREGQDFSVRPEQPLVFGTAQGNVESPENPPHRFIQMMGSATPEGNKITVGYVTGYSLLEGITIPSVRAAQCATPLIIHTSAKTYPSAMDKKAGKILAGTALECLAYRQYFDPSMASEHATSCYWHKEGDTYVVYVDYHKPVARDVLKLPPLFQGKQVSVIEVTPGVTILSGETVPSSGVVISTAENHGSLIFAVGNEGADLRQ